MAAEKWGKVFDFSSADKNRTNALCKLCNRNYKDRRGVYSNFIKHLKRIHSSDYDEIMGYEAESSNEDNMVTEHQVPVNPTPKNKQQNQFILSGAKNLIIRCNLPFSFVENTGFRSFLKECNFKSEPVSARKLKNVVIPQFINNVRQRIHEALSDANDLTLTIDGWSDRRSRSYLGVTCHFVDAQMKPKAYLVDFVRFKSPHSGENIQRLTEDILERFNIKEKVFKIITDNAKSMIKAYKFGLFGDEDADVFSNQTDSIVNMNGPFNDDDDGRFYRMFWIRFVEIESSIEKFGSIRSSLFVYICLREPTILLIIFQFLVSVALS